VRQAAAPFQRWDFDGQPMERKSERRRADLSSAWSKTPRAFIRFTNTVASCQLSGNFLASAAFLGVNFVRGQDVFVTVATADSVLQPLIKMAAETEMQRLATALEEINAPLYITDPKGIVTHFNSACIGFSGRTPAAGKDRWCVTWKLYTADCEFLPHDQCPMAATVRSKRPLRGMIAIAERPDGTRVKFMPFPTPLVTASGEFLGAINMLLDVSDPRQIDDLRSQAQRSRRLASSIGDSATSATLDALALEYDAMADTLEASEAPTSSAQ
jgi:PAS domain-containing protein